MGGFDSQYDQEGFLLSIKKGYSAHSTPAQWVPWAVSSAIKWPAREAGHSLLFCAEFRNDGAILPPPYIFMTWCLIKHRNNFTYYLN
jgi:hypothetical protein